MMKNNRLFFLVLILMLTINAFGQKKKSKKKSEIKEKEIIHYVDRNTPFDTIIPENVIIKFKINDTTTLETKVRSDYFFIEVFFNDQIVNKLNYLTVGYCDGIGVYRVNHNQKDTLYTGISFNQELSPTAITTYNKDSLRNRYNIGNHTYFTDYDNLLKFIRIYKEDGKSFELRSYFETGELEFRTTFNEENQEIGPRIRYSKTKGIISKKTRGFTYENWEKFIYSTSRYNKHQ